MILVITMTNIIIYQQPDPFGGANPHLLQQYLGHQKATTSENQLLGLDNQSLGTAIQCCSNLDILGTNKVTAASSVSLTVKLLDIELEDLMLGMYFSPLTRPELSDSISVHPYHYMWSI